MSAKKILLVDDEPHIVRVMQMGLRRAGYTVEVARNGLEGLEKFRALQPDAMVVDVDMPKMNGVELCEALAEEYPAGLLNTFMSTSRAEAELRRWAENKRGIRFLEKPISMRILVGELDALFSAANDGEADQ